MVTAGEQKLPSWVSTLCRVLVATRRTSQRKATAHNSQERARELLEVDRYSKLRYYCTDAEQRQLLL